MATIIWDMPTISPPPGGNISAFSVAINDLNDKLLSVGLINYSGENEAALSGIINYTFPNVTVAGYQSFFLCKLKYKMPIGNGVTQYADIVGSEYKNIVQESYDPTECFIEFEFGFTYNISDAASDSRQYLILYCNTKFYNNNNIVNSINKCTISGAYSTAAQLSSFSQDRKCVISLTGNTFHLYWYCRNFTTTSDAILTLPNYTNTPLLFFTFIRENNKFYLFTKQNYQTTIYNNAYNGTYANYNTNLYPLELQELYLDGSATRTRSLIEFCKKIDTNISPITTDNTKASFATYYNLSDSLKVNPYILRGYVGSNYPPLQQIDYYEVDTIHKGIKTRLKYYNSGRLNIKIRSTPLLNETTTTTATFCTFLIFIGDHPCTTNYL